MSENGKSIYEQRGLNIGQPGTTEKFILPDGNDFWMLKHVFLSLGGIKAYVLLYGFGSDEALQNEQIKLLQLRDKLSPKVKSADENKYQEATLYFRRGQENINDSHSQSKVEA